MLGLRAALHPSLYRFRQYRFEHFPHPVMNGRAAGPSASGTAAKEGWLVTADLGAQPENEPGTGSRTQPPNPETGGRHA
jgi:hypothetical protein